MKDILLFISILVSLQLQAQKEISIDSIVTYSIRNFIAQPDSAQYYLHKGIQMARQKKDLYQEGLFLTKLISQKTSIRDYDSAYFYFREANRFIHENEVSKLYGDVHSEIAETFYYQEKMDSALVHFKKASEIWDQQGDRIGVLISKNNIANVYQTQGNYKEAIINMLEAAKNVDTSQYKYIKAQIYLNVSELYNEIGETEESIEFAERSLEIALTNKNYPLDMVRAYVALANHSRIQNNHSRSNELLDKAEKVLVDHELLSKSYLVVTSRSSLLIDQERFSEAIELIEDVYKQYDLSSLNDFEAFSLKKNLAISYSETGKGSKALDIYTELLKKALQDQRLDDLASIYSGMSIVKERRGDFSGALSDQRQYQLYRDSILGKEKQIAIKDAKVKYETEKKDKQLAETRANLAEKELQVRQKNYLIFGSLGLAIILGILGYLVYKQQKLKQKQLKKEHELKTALAKIEIQNKLQEQRLRISRDLHDNIGAQLTFIISSIDNLKYALNDENVNKRLSKISGFTTETIYQLRDTIWAMNKNEITFEDLQTRISNFIDNARIASEDTVFQFNIPSNIDVDHTFTSIQGMNMYRIIQESVNNASKYAEAANIDVSIQRDASNYLIKIEDNGKGFDPKKVQLGNGINNIQKRARDLGGEASIKAEIGKGTIVSFTVAR